MFLGDLYLISFKTQLILKKFYKKMDKIQLISLTVAILQRMFGEEIANKVLNALIKPHNFFYIDRIHDFQNRKPIPRLTLFLTGKGCQWALETGGCSMCAFGKFVHQIGRNFSNQDILSLSEIAITLTKSKKPINLTIYNGGSFLNDKEISPNVQLEICKKVREHPSIQTLFIESRVEFIDEKKIKRIKNILKGKPLTIGIGLESQDDKIRNTIIKKGLSKENYEKAIKLLKKEKIKVLTYVFLKPIELSEKEAIYDTIKTIEYAFQIGTDEVALESAFVQEGTLMAKLFKENKYKPPWLWSIIEVIKKTFNLGPVHVGGFSDEPLPIATPDNCPQCSEKIKKLLQQCREIHDINLFNNLECECYKKWEEEARITP